MRREPKGILLRGHCLRRAEPASDARLACWGAGAALEPPGFPPRAGVFAFALGEVEVVAEVLAGEDAQLVGGGVADLGDLVRQAGEQPVDAVVVLMACPPRSPAAHARP